jgi:hypothetical protein
MSEKERGEAEYVTRSDEDALLVAILENERASFAGLADVLRWTTRDGNPHKAGLQRAADRMKRGGYVRIERGALALTEKGNQGGRARQIQRRRGRGANY